MKTIQSRDNPFFKELSRLAGSARQRGKAGQTLLDGAHLLAAYLDAGKQPQHILLNAAALHDAEIAALLERAAGIPVTQLDDRLFAELSELKTPTGILTVIDLPHPAGTAADSRLALMLEDIQDPGNLGSMLRSAAAAGCDAVFLSKGCADAWSPKVLRAAMGGHFALDIHERQDLPEVAKAFRGALLAASLQATHSLYDCDLRGKVAFLVGNEGAGLSGGLLRLATQTIAIPMPGRVESLNAAAATAICLFEAVRQRM
ncbi:TrmH family RNA methyltransferase [Candidatus Ferrigenium straubiae]|jgi:TrmH family RNA methyltransferase|uniref:TrmH family RNA methyltransferase n=1 Tax=Candidatus Ferrigenium straubiae TaxID=2919506 RepID=UPI003F4ADFE8